jgi:hypothetical protein
MAEWIYTNVLHEPRKALGISVLEYCVLDYIYKTQTHPIYGKNGWTNAGCHRVAAFFDLSSGTVKKLFDRMDNAGLLERVANDMKRATEKFYSIAYESDVQKVNEYCSKSEQQGVQKVNSNRSKSEHYNKKNEIKIKEEYKKPQNKIEESKEQNDILATVHDQVGETAVKVVGIIPSKAKKTKYIYPPSQEELIPLFFDKLTEKKREHPQIIDCWNWANMEAEKFFLHWERKGWTIQRLPNAIATWINGSITFGTVTKPCPIQYKNNPANALQPEQPKPEQTQITKQDLEARKAMFAAAKAELNQIGA